MAENKLILSRSLKILEDTGETLRDINNLLKQLSRNHKEISIACLKKLLKSENIEICVAIYGDKIIGMGSIHFLETFIRKVGIIEDVVVHRKYRHCGIGEGIISNLISEARKRSVDRIVLTSTPKRIAANSLYKKIGFKKRQTNYYYLQF